MPSLVLSGKGCPAAVRWEGTMREQGRWKTVICATVMCISLCGFLVSAVRDYRADNALQKQQETLAELKEDIEDIESAKQPLPLPSAEVQEVLDDTWREESEENADRYKPTAMLPEYRKLYEKNNDLIGWLTIEDTVIDYPVMQTLEDEDYYLYRDFYGEENKNGCLILDTDSVAGSGTRENDYQNGTAPGTNLIIHGHTMKSGQMFGGLKKYAGEAYGQEHRIICFDSLYEHREYELIAVFYSQVYTNADDVFKYYHFFQADTQEAFDDWYGNIKKMSLYDTGVTAGFGDEFITLSCCAYHVENGRFVVVGKRIK